MRTYLTEIVAAHRAARERDPRDLDQLVARALASPSPRDDAADPLGTAGADGRGRRPGFAEALGGDELQVVAEIKRRSPSKGDLDPDLDPVATARAYASGGAAALSVLTDAEFFGGSGEDLRAARAAVDLPVLRKDFTVSPADVCDARLLGADAVLLITAALDRGELAELHRLAGRLSLDALVEVHDEDELERALEVGAGIVGVNQRDLRSFEVDPERAERLAPRIPPGVVAVAESGVRRPEDADRLADAGYQALLVGETLVRAPDRAAAVRELRGRRPVRSRQGSVSAR